MVHIVGVAGSLRTKSFNAMLLRTVVETAPAGTTIEIGSIAEIPLYNGDVEASSGAPAAVRDLKEKIAAADGLLLVSPEYNNSIPGVFKNAIDWISRPSGDLARAFGGCPVGVIGATPGAGATALSQAAWLPVLRALGMLPFFGLRVGIANAAKVFDEQGTLHDPVVRAQVAKYVAGFADFSARHRRKSG